MNDTETETTPTATAALERVLAPLEAPKRQPLLEALMPVLSWVNEIQTRAETLRVTGPGQTRKEQSAKLLRLEIRDKRVELDKARKRMKESLILEGRAIDGAFDVFKAAVLPREAWLREQETFTERAEQAKRDELRDARVEALRALGVAGIPEGLGAMTTEHWELHLTDAKAAKEARERVLREEEEARVEAARIVAEKRAKAEADRKAKAAAEEAARIEEAEAREAEIAKLRAEKAEQDEERAVRQREDEERKKRDEARAFELRREVEAKEIARLNEIERQRVADEIRANASDKELIMALAEDVRDLAKKLPSCKGKQGISIVEKVNQRISALASDLVTRAEKM